MAAYFLHKRGGSMSYLKLMKLMYLADRESMDRFEEPMTDDAWFSMDKGPVLSRVLDLFQGGSRSHSWDLWVNGGPVAHEVSLAKRPSDRDDLDELSDADIDILETVWNSHGHKTRWELVDYTHSHCGEWVDPNHSAKPISPQDMLKNLGRSPQEIERAAAEFYQRRTLKELMSRIR